MPDDKDKNSLIPIAIGIAGGVAGFSYGMKRDATAIDLAMEKTVDACDRKRLQELINTETSNPEYPYVSGKVREEIHGKAGYGKNKLLCRASPLAFCVASGVTCYLGSIFVGSFLDRGVSP